MEESELPNNIFSAEAIEPINVSEINNIVIDKEKSGNLWKKIKEKLPFWKKEIQDNKPVEVLKQLSEIEVDNISEIVNTPEIVVNNIENNKLFVEGMPEGTEISTELYFGEKQNMKEFRGLITEGNWNLKMVDKNERLWLEIKPKTPEGIVSLGDGKYIDSNVASLDNDGNVSIIPESGYKLVKDGVIPTEEGIIYRGLSKVELDAMVSSGFIGSKGDMGQRNSETLTFFAPKPEYTFGYANTPHKMPGYQAPTFEKQSYIIAVKDPGNHVFEQSSEFAVKSSIPTSEIVNIYEYKPVVIKEGAIPLQKAQDGRIGPGDILNNYHFAPRILETAIKDISEEVLKK